jgi:hypothetical protein
MKFGILILKLLVAIENYNLNFKIVILNVGNYYFNLKMIF